MYPDPVLMLAAFAALTLVLAVLLWPRRGLAARWLRVRQETERVRLEDALKHLHDYERVGRSGTLENLAGRLEISRSAASELVSRLAERGLVESGPTGWELTEGGRAYALRVVRTHRLWERYLADRTGVPPVEWHLEAERVEHQLSPAEADALAARLGHPRYDPHGDPIPTVAGEIPARTGTPLTRAEAGWTVVVRHLEDEPPEVFERLVRDGFAPGVVVEVQGVSGTAVRVRVGGRDRSLRPVDAANVTVERTGEAASPGVERTLADAALGEEVRVTGISAACQGLQRRRLLDLGVVPGTRIVPELVSTSGDPVAYRIRGALIALRREQAALVGIESGIAERAG
ncbi:MAG TPA: metal-dependent transcriptional regulator [Longimicrobiales bacterium]|nr:metal-dependent transcriptional regulator [Longimicrobiales bacterium]